MDIKNFQGMVLHLYKHLDASMFDDDPRPKEKGENCERTMLAFGNFDRVCFEPIYRFVEFLSQSSDAHRWTGGRKDIMLYPLEADEHRRFVFGDKEPGYVQPPFLFREESSAEVTAKRNFFLVSMLYVSSKAKARINTYEAFLNYIKDAVYKIVSRYNEELIKLGRATIICEAYGSFNSSEVALIWAADQFVDVQYIVDHIRCLRFNNKDEKERETVFASTYTITALTSDPPDLLSVAGGARIQLVSSTTQKDACVREYNEPINYLSKVERQEPIQVDCCAGEYDYIIESLPPHLEMLLKPKVTPSVQAGSGELYVDNDHFRSLFSQSTTQLFYRLKDIREEFTKIPWESLIEIEIDEADWNSNFSTQWENTRKIAGANGDAISKEFKSFKEKVLSHIHSTSTFGCNLDYLFSDYIQCVNTTPDRQWAEDLKMQFSASIKLLTSYFDRNPPDNGIVDQNVVNRISEVLSILEKQIHHVSDAGKLLFEEPCSHSESTSQYDLLFHMYYGVAKSILKNVYAVRESKANSTQSTLIPLIRFEPVPVLESKIYFDLPEINPRLVDIAMPQNAWCEPSQYIPLLVHELYHYVAPMDRAIRNEILAKILITETSTLAVQAVLEKARETILDNIKYQDFSLAKATNDEFYSSLVRVVKKTREIFISYFWNVEITKAFATDISNDIQWKIYHDKLWDWYRGAIKEYNADDENNFGYHLVKSIKHLSKKLMSEMSKSETHEIDKALYTIIIHELAHDVTNSSYKPVDDLPRFDEIISDAQKKIWGTLETQLREIMPDIAMVRLSKINIAEYLLTFASFQDRSLSDPANLYEGDICLSLRIGFVLDFILSSPDTSAKKRLKMMMKYKNEFCKKYVASVENCRWSKHNKKIKTDVCAGKWFSFFVDQYEDYLENYIAYHDILKNIASEQIIPIWVDEDSCIIGECSQKYFSALLAENNPKAIFESNISSIHKFQHQGFFVDLKIAPKNVKPISSKSTSNWPTSKPFYEKAIDKTTNWSITCSSEHSKPIACVSAYLAQTHYKIFGTKPEKCDLWYRGSQNSEFEILPSIMVHFLDEEQLSHAISIYNIWGVNSRGSLWEYQKSILERFKNKADGAPEFLNSASYTASDYIALMQHYGQYTCYLDWSEDVYTALFFALESEVQREESKHGGNDASLYIFDPMLYNRARKMLIKRVTENFAETFCPNDSWMHKQANKIQDMPDGYIPNLSLTYNRDRFGMFSFDIPENDDKVCLNETY